MKPNEDQFLDNITNLPAAPGVEAAILTSMLLEKDSMIDGVTIFDESCFFKEKHRLLFRAMKELHNERRDTDLPNVASWLNDRGLLEAAGGAYEIAQITQQHTGVNSVRNTAPYLLDLAERRQVIRCSLKAAMDASKPENDIQDVKSSLSQNAIYADVGGVRRQGFTMAEALKSAILAGEEAVMARRRGDAPNIPTGITFIDRYTGGLERKRLTLIGGRPGMGKSGVMLHMIIAAAKAGKRILLFSLEMSKEEIAGRLAAHERAVSSSRAITSGRMTRKDFITMPDLQEKIDADWGRNIIVFEPKKYTVQDVRAEMMKAKAAGKGFDAVYIDYLQLMKRPVADREDLAVGMISQELKMISMEFNAAVIALSQLSRNPENRADRRPIASDLRESGSLEQDADMIIFPYRPSYYDEAVTSRGEPSDNLMEVIISKNRSGAPGSFWVKYDEARFMITDHDIPEPEPQQIEEDSRVIQEF